MALETRHSEPGPAHKGEPVSIKESWVQCDRCDKWRRVPASLAESLDEDAPWYCEHNVGRYNSCSMPQEMTDAEIDDGPETAPGPGAGPQSPAELDDGGRALAALRRTPIWQLVTEKLYAYRRRHVQEEDDIMICQCPHIWPSDTTTIGCGERCLNRMLNIECVPGYCPCGDRCTNQQFSRRAYAPLEVRRAGAKGFGLFTRDGVRAGQFVVEYVGEVLDEEEYARRRAFYLAAGQRHYYFMNIGNGEVIDACRRGGLGRFINHSCEPNCETQKWQVGGELSIGLFALRDVPPGGELTFDYNFERYGDKPMRCLCGAAGCRGVIGGGAADKGGSRAEGNVVEEDAAATLHASSHLDPEPIMLSGRPSPALDKLLDRVVGIGTGAPFTPAERKLLGSLRRRQEATGAEGTARPPSPPSAPEDESADEQVALLERNAPRQTDAPVVEDKESDSSVTSRLGSSADGSGRGGPTPSKLSASEEEGSDDSAAAADEGAGLAAWTAQRRAPRTRVGRQAPDERRGLAATPRRVRTPPPATPARSGGAAPAAPAARRSEVDRRLDALVEASTGRLRSSAPDCVLGLLRLFNLCDVGALLVGLGAGASDAGAALRLRARLADLSLLLEVLLRTKRADARRELVRCGALQQLLSVLGGGLAASTGTAEATVAAKLLRAVRELCSGPQDLRGARSAHGSFLDEVRRLVRHSARVVRDAAHELLRAVVPLSDNGGDCYAGGATSNFGGGAYANGGAIYNNNNTNGTYNTYAQSHAATPSSILSTSSSSPRHRGFAPGRGPVVPPPAASSPFGKAPLGAAPSHFSRSPSISRFGERVAARAGSGPLARAASTSSLVAPPAARSPAARSPAEARVVPGRHKRSRWDDSTRRTSWHVAPPEPEPSWTSARSGHAVTGADESAGAPAPPADYGDPAFFSARMPQRDAAAATWDEPDADFAAYVSAVVACRVGKYLQPDHPSRLSRRQAEQVHRRLSRDIFAKEQEAYRERQAMHLFKAIEREKIDARIKEYVRDSVHRLAAQGGLQAGG